MIHLPLLLATLLAQVTPPPTPPPLSTPTPNASAQPSGEPSEEPSAQPSAEPTPTPSPSPSPTPTGPRLTLSAVEVDLNPAQQRTVLVSGASAPLTATMAGKLVNLAVDPNAANVTITATQATGSDTIHLTDANGATGEIAVKVAFNAGTIQPQTTLRVTGAPVDPLWLARQVANWIARVTLAQPGTQTSIGTATPLPAPLAPGQQANFAIPITIHSADGTYFDQTGTTAVTVQNLALDPFAPPVLYYDDDPEHVGADGVLFRGTVTPAQAARLYFYHDATTDPRRVIVLLTATSESPTTVQLIDATAGPNMDVLTVGNVITRDFLQLKARSEGVVVDLPQDEPYVVHDVPAGPRQLVAGSIDVRILSGGPVTVTVLAASAGVDPRTLMNGPVVGGDGHHRTGTFTIANFGTDALAYDAGGADAKVVIGDREPTPPNADSNGTTHDYGDYGVLHTINATLNNPSDAPATAYLYMRPIAGVARASFLVDGNLVQVGCVRTPVPYQVATFALAPHQTTRSFVQTMTDGGSFYPIEIGVTATPPQPEAPPMAAPDGCFPKPGYVAPSPSPLPGASAAPGAASSPGASPSPSPSATPTLVPGPVPPPPAST